jgi:hypothetical protein
MSNDIRDIIERLAILEGRITPTEPVGSQNPQQKSVHQLPALFKPRDISPTLTKKPYQKHPMDGKLVGDSVEPTKSPLEEAMQEVEEDMLSKVKRTFVDYLERLEDNNKIDSHLVRKAKDELDIANDPDPENEEIEELKIEKVSDPEFYVNLINVFMEYYNKKNGFNKNFYEGLDNEFEMNEQMRTFNTALYLLDNYREINEFVYNFECMDNIFSEMDDVKKNKMVENNKRMFV